MNTSEDQKKAILGSFKFLSKEILLVQILRKRWIKLKLFISDLGRKFFEQKEKKWKDFFWGVGRKG